MDAPAMPPTGWMGDVEVPGPAAPSAAEGGDASDVAACASSWKHVKSIANRDETRPADLYDLLAHGVREAQYAFQPQEWPPLLRALPPGATEMPSLVVERYASRQTVAFCGTFPEISHAWASVDNSVFLWRYDRWKDVPVEFSGENQSIVAVGLVTPKPGVFVEAFQHLLVVCTTVDVLLVGVCFAGSSEDPHDGISLQPLPLYGVPVDDKPMISVVGTAGGRIFLGGADGELYELIYKASGSGWGSKPCSKVCHTRGLRRLLPSFIPSLVLKAPSPLTDLVVDEGRNVLYARFEDSRLQVFDLGANGAGAPSRVAECNDLVSEASRALGGHDAFGRSGSDRRGTHTVFMAPIPTSESSLLHLLTVSADGRRVYWSIAPPALPSAGSPPRPSRLRAEVARAAPPPPLPRGDGATAVQAPHTLEVVAASYASGVLVLADALPSGATRLLALVRDFAAPPAGVPIGGYAPVPGPRELLVELPENLVGEPCAIRGSLVVPALAGSRDELLAISAADAPRFAVTTTAGTLEIERLRPVDVLSSILLERSQRSLEHLFHIYGAAEAAALCVLLACRAQEIAGPAKAASVAAAARAALEDPRICPETALRESYPSGAGYIQDPYRQGGFDMGGVVPVAEPVWSGVHLGLCLYAARVLSQDVWDGPVAVTAPSSPSLVRTALPSRDLQRLEAAVRKLSAFVGEVIARRAARRPLSQVDELGRASLAVDAVSAAKRAQLEEAVSKENQQTRLLRAFLNRTAQAIFLLRVLAEHNLPRLVARGDPSLRDAVTKIRFRDWVSNEEGERVATQLVANLVSEHMTESGGVAEDLAASLSAGCPSFFNESDRVYYRGAGVLRRAEAAASRAEALQLVREAVDLLKRAPLSVDLSAITPQLTALGAPAAAVELAIARARALDPTDAAAGAGPDAAAAVATREGEAYGPLALLLTALLSPGQAKGTPYESLLQKLGDPSPTLGELVAVVAASSDPVLHRILYRALVAARAEARLLALDTPFLEAYLISAGGLAGATPGSRLVLASLEQREHVNLLARLYVKRLEYGNAAQVYEFLSDASLAPGAPAGVVPSLEERKDLVDAAVLQAHSCGDVELVDRLEGKARVVALQARIAEALKRQAPDRLGDLLVARHELMELYNDFAAPNELWSLCLEAIDLSGYGDEAYVRHLWDLALKRAWQDGWDASAGNEASPALPHESAAAAVRSAAALVTDLGERFYPNEKSFPIAHTALRLEQMAAGAWPAATGVRVDQQFGVAALATACRGSFSAVLGAYEFLLSPHSVGESQTPALKERFLLATLWLLDSARSSLASGATLARGDRAGARQELALLADAATNAASLARGLPELGGSSLAARLSAIAASLTADQSGRPDFL